MSAEEYFDVFDDDGQPTGETLPKSQVHAGGLWHRGVYLCVTNGKGDVLQQLRGSSPAVRILPGVWDIFAVAGHVSAGESPLEALVREAVEEIGLVIDSRLRATLEEFLLPVVTKSDYPVVDPKFANGGYQHRTHDYSYILWLPDFNIADCKLEANKVLGLRWYPISKLESDLRQPGSDAYAGHAHRPPDDDYLCQELAWCIKNFLPTN